MKLFTKNAGSNYLAKVVKLPKPEKHPNADRLAVVKIDGQSVIVGPTAKEGEVYIFCPLECAINREFLTHTNSFENVLLNKDQSVKGFFREHGRVRAVKLRGVPSEGYLIPVLEFLKWTETNPADWEPDWIGKEFDTIEYPDGSQVLFCEKYVPKQQHSSGPSNQLPKNKATRFNRLVEGQFNFHIDTPNLRKNLHIIQPDDLITISSKLHGTSAIFSNILVKRKLKWYEKLAKRFGVKVQETEYDQIYSSRSVIKNQYIYEEDKKHNHYYKEDVWALAKKKIEHALEPGITIYAEIVGQTPGGKWIQKNYDYGTNPNEFEVYVYRITSTNANGNVLDFTTNQIKRFCEKYQIKHVPIHYHGIANDFVQYLPEDAPSWSEALLAILSRDYLEKPCQMSKNNVPTEGVVITLDRKYFTPLKLVSFAFKERETKLLDEGEVDMETEESNNEV
jgi:hypothetical protein